MFMEVNLSLVYFAESKSTKALQRGTSVFWLNGEQGKWGQGGPHGVLHSQNGKQSGISQEYQLGQGDIKMDWD